MAAWFRVAGSCDIEKEIPAIIWFKIGFRKAGTLIALPFLFPDLIAAIKVEIFRLPKEFRFSHAIYHRKNTLSAWRY